MFSPLEQRFIDMHTRLECAAAAIDALNRFFEDCAPDGLSPAQARERIDAGCMASMANDYLSSARSALEELEDTCLDQLSTIQVDLETHVSIEDAGEKYAAWPLRKRSFGMKNFSKLSEDVAAQEQPSPEDRTAFYLTHSHSPGFLQAVAAWEQTKQLPPEDRAVFWRTIEILSTPSGAARIRLAKESPKSHKLIKESATESGV